jgi:hypothetical protein
MNIVCIAQEDLYDVSLVNETRTLTGLTAPTNESRTVVVLWSDPANQGANPVSLGQMYAEGQRLSQGQQVQGQPSGESSIDLAQYHVTVVPGMAAAPTDTMGTDDNLVTTIDEFDVGEARPRRVAHFLASTFPQPAVDATYDVPMLDATEFSAVTVGARVLVDGCLYQLEAGSTLAAPGTLKLKNLGLGGARIALTA